MSILKPHQNRCKPFTQLTQQVLTLAFSAMLLSVSTAQAQDVFNSNDANDLSTKATGAQASIEELGLTYAPLPSVSISHSRIVLYRLSDSRVMVEVICVRH